MDPRHVPTHPGCHRTAALRAAVIVVALAAALGGCAGVPLPAAPPAVLLPDDAYPPVAVDTDPAQANALSPAMQRFLKEEIEPRARVHGARAAMMYALFQTRALRLEYDASITRSASEAFDARAGNCLSLTLMTGALAQAMGLNVSYQAVDSGPAWSRAGGYLAYSGHVNLVLDGGATRTAGASWEQRAIVDFLPPKDAETHRSHPIGERTLVGMFLNNRAVEALTAGRAAEAYAWVRSALRESPDLVPAWNTLALLHRQRGDLGLATMALEQAAKAEPDNTRVLANLVGALDVAGRGAEAAPWRERLHRLEPVAPFWWFERGREAMARGDWPAAEEAFARELARDPDQHEVHAWAARAAGQLGDVDAVRRHLRLARELGPTPQLQALYGAKLDRLNALRAQ